MNLAQRARTLNELLLEREAIWDRLRHHHASMRLYELAQYKRRLWAIASRIAAFEKRTSRSPV